MTPDPARKLAKRAVAQIAMLSAQLLLGMAVNLIGLPKEASGTSKIATTVFLVLHVGIAVGLLVGSLLAIRLARAVGPHFVRDTRIGAAVITATAVAGVLAFVRDNNWWSYAMTVGFLLAFLLYGAMFVYAGRQAKG